MALSEVKNSQPAFSSSPPWSLSYSQRRDTGEEATFRQRAVARWAGRFRHRHALPEEFHLQTIDEPFGFEVIFIAPRVPLAITIKTEPAKNLNKSRVEVWENDCWRQEIIDYVTDPGDHRGAIYIRIKRLSLITKLRVFVDGLEPEDDFNVATAVGDFSYADWLALIEARRLVAEGYKQVAEDEYQEALQLAPENGAAALELGRLLKERGQTEQAERWLLTAGAYGRANEASELLRAIYEKGGEKLATEAQELQKQAAGWPTGEHYGTICLQMKQLFWLGFSSWHLIKHRMLIEIRRKAAARMLRRMSFRLTPHNESLLFTRLRILQQDGTIKTVSDEQLVFTDSPEHDLAVRTAESKDAIFLLPELHSGDIIELEYCLVHDNGLMKNGKPNFYLHPNLASDFPTFTSSVQIKGPADWSIKCIGIHGAATPVHDQEKDGWQSYVSEGNRLMPQDWRASSLERTLQDPQICASWDNRSWEEVGTAELRSVGSDVEPRDPLPAVLRDVIAGGDSVLEKLQRGFNWVRDRLKYVSLLSAKKRIAKQGRAQHIIDRGVGDCHDKAYLLHLICRELELESEFLLVGDNDGCIVRELPGSQFNHILLRAKLNGRWLYFDATDTITPCGRVPGGLQGLSVLRMCDPFQLIVIPEHDPTTNILTIEEKLECSPEGELRGWFRVEATGVPGRLLDDRWKSLSMEAPEESRAAQLILNDHLPAARIMQWDIARSGAEGDRFVFTGEHLRSRLTRIGRQRIGVIRWNTVFFPWDSFRDRRWGDPAIFPLPVTMKFAVSFMDNNHWQVAASPRITDFDEEFGTLGEKRGDTPSPLEIIRELVVKKRFISGPSTARIPEYINAFEDALQIAILFSEIPNH
ncbi:DUF3857 domain-containing protein [Candidatus Zixiibacteriota bacterium]